MDNLNEFVGYVQGILAAALFVEGVGHTNTNCLLWVFLPRNVEVEEQNL
jgi:hypothetical protein